MGFLLTSLTVGTLPAERYYCVGALEKFGRSIRRKMPMLLCQGVKIFTLTPDSVLPTAPVTVDGTTASRLLT